MQSLQSKPSDAEIRHGCHICSTKEGDIISYEVHVLPSFPSFPSPISMPRRLISKPPDHNPLNTHALPNLDILPVTMDTPPPSLLFPFNNKHIDTPLGAADMDNHAPDPLPGRCADASTW